MKINLGYQLHLLLSDQISLIGVRQLGGRRVDEQMMMKAIGEKTEIRASLHAPIRTMLLECLRNKNET